ncbi:Uncharacterised protein [uncultured archaeon]|nr:Uncharacterised protein [uncultured archaeon]
MLTKVQIGKNKRNILDLFSNVNRLGVSNLVDFICDGNFFTSPASTRFHSNYPGGLAEHSYDVYKQFSKRVSDYNLNVPFESVILTGICHDLCKIGVYFENSLKDGNRSESKPYKFQDSFPYGHGEKSVFILSQYIHPTPQEALIIRWHMGNDDPAWKDYQEDVSKSFPEVVFFQNVDREASLMRKVG